MIDAGEVGGDVGIDDVLVAIVAKLDDARDRAVDAAAAPVRIGGFDELLLEGAGQQTRHGRLQDPVADGRDQQSAGILRSGMFLHNDLAERPGAISTVRGMQEEFGKFRWGLPAEAFDGDAVDAGAAFIIGHVLPGRIDRVAGEVQNHPALQSLPEASAIYKPQVVGGTCGAGCQPAADWQSAYRLLTRGRQQKTQFSPYRSTRPCDSINCSLAYLARGVTACHLQPWSSAQFASKP